MSMTYDGMSEIRFDDKGEAIFISTSCRLKKGGALEVTHIQSELNGTRVPLTCPLPQWGRG